MFRKGIKSRCSNTNVQKKLVELVGVGFFYSCNYIILSRATAISVILSQKHVAIQDWKGRPMSYTHHKRNDNRLRFLRWCLLLYLRRGYRVLRYTRSQHIRRLPNWGYIWQVKPWLATSMLPMLAVGLNMPQRVSRIPLAPFCSPTMHADTDRYDSRLSQSSLDALPSSCSRRQPIANQSPRTVVS